MGKRLPHQEQKPTHNVSKFGTSAVAVNAADIGEASTYNDEESLKKSKSRKLHTRTPISSLSSNVDAEEFSSTSKRCREQYIQHPELVSLSQDKIDSYVNQNGISVSIPSKATLRPVIEFSYLSPTPEEVEIFKSYISPTPIQASTWPYLLAGQDVVGVAETGSGKTLAFGVPLVRHVAQKQTKSKLRIRAVIVAPTRELALQIHEQLASLVSGTSLKCVCIYGGVPKDEQRTALAHSQIVIATPGRLNDFIQEGSADLSHVRFVVLDEADRMLEKGFEDEVRKIVQSTASKSKRQTAMFTATWPESIRNLAATFMINPVRVNIGDNAAGELRANARVSQRVEVIDPNNKQARFLQILNQHSREHGKNDRILAFCLYKKEAARLERFLHAKGFRVGAIHGDMNQAARLESLEAFRSGRVPLLVATDVAARGLDIPSVKLVINVTFPLTAEDYVHRIGRTGRAGKEGLAITLFTQNEKALSGSLINVLRAAKQPVPDELLKFGATVKRKQHESYGAFYRDSADMPQKNTRITFD